MKKEIISGLALVTLSTLPGNALNFGTGNIYDKYLACHKKDNTQQTAQKDLEKQLRETQTEGKLIPETIPIKTIDSIKRQNVQLKYGVPYPGIQRPKPKEEQIIETKYGIPYPPIKPDKIEAAPPDFSTQTRYMVPVPPTNK